ncbi:MAG: GTP cyclohydrolase I FolE [Acidimicrobiia bacterium]|nr:MAG: GTP cyclohydrolase I FolE [Acidimicrobiia bacterium]
MRLISDEMAANFEDGPVLDAKCKIEVANAVAHILKAVGEDQERDGLRNTPDRVARMYDEILLGYTVDPVKLLNDALFDVDYAEMVVVGDIDFWSMCEHHLLPIFGQAHVAYLPDKKVVGLSKIPRVVEAFARRLQIQERMTRQIAELIDDLVEPQGVGVVVQATHLCVAMRGAKKQNTHMRTTALLGSFLDNEKTRNEFFDSIEPPHHMR